MFKKELRLNLADENLQLPIFVLCRGHAKQKERRLNKYIYWYLSENGMVERELIKTKNLKKIKSNTRDILALAE